MSQTIDISGRFTETGNLLQIEYARKAASKGNTVIGVQFSEGVLLAVDKHSSSKIVDIQSLKTITALSRQYAMAYSGLPHDNNVITYLMKDFTKQVLLQSEKEPAEEFFLGTLREYLVYFGSYMSLRPVGCEFLISSLGRGKASLFHADPSGSISKCRAYAVGCNAQAAKTELEKVDCTGYTLEEAIQWVVRVMHLSRDGMADGTFEIEMMAVQANGVQKRVDRQVIERYVAEAAEISVQ
ncbi:20S proteasome subunit alpha 7 [Nematocida homosporus]|uniref:20S proteasome subunit alpha 7 n=1 Tax=Nematocida homosporus TaxID=1912981 RepID=UPI00221FA5B9|nr:20S proteasome subunit alpha 7 [Nematocida homosporus]KAI5187063.1 20S proteasome subunit alpha 7 [Nematocida homosporus]